MRKIFLLFLIVSACTEKKADTTANTLLSPSEFIAKYKETEDAILLDVRTEEEVRAGAIAGQMNVVYDEAFATKLSNLEQKPIFVYCGSGIRSAKAARILREKGYTPVYEMEGGMKAWKAAGFPVQ
ncbi:MAG: rhodanese-like domain-containing protein [Cyclobacteriaceae bacterium]|nr:rhodanese-like domain-containing protein [Cyclobacteriaceae bacterium]